MINENSGAVAHVPPDDRDRELVKGLLEARPEAGVELCDRFGPKLLAFVAARFPYDRSVAEDITVQALANAAHHIKQFNPRRASFAAWLYGIARRQIREEVRRRTRHKAVPPGAAVPLEEAADLPCGEELAEAVASRVDAQALLARLAQELSELELEVLLLDCLDELSVREIGQAVGRSERAIHSLLYRAKAKARERMSHDEPR